MQNVADFAESNPFRPLLYFGCVAASFVLIVGILVLAKTVEIGEGDGTRVLLSLLGIFGCVVM